mgnify:CR=1 FL=1
MNAQICPVCKGTGKYTVVKYRETNYLYPFNTSPIEFYSERTCHGCNGKGWVAVSESVDIDFNKIT